jgi:CRISPR-associated exonuclease Cas4
MTENKPDMNIMSNIAISSIIRAYHCPRQYYFHKESKFKPSESYTVCKQVSCAYPDHTEEEIWNMIILIQPDISPDARSFLSSCICAMTHTPIRPWTETDITVKSDKVGIYGLLDKYDALSGEYTLTRCTTAPKNGCWPDDAIRTAALLICIEETSAKRLKGMYIEYIPSGIIRYYEPTPKDRRRLIQIIRQIQDVNRGLFPSKPLHPPCDSCKYYEKCEKNKPKTLSFLFKK